MTRSSWTKNSNSPCRKPTLAWAALKCSPPGKQGWRPRTLTSAAARSSMTAPRTRSASISEARTLAVARRATRTCHRVPSTPAASAPPRCSAAKSATTTAPATRWAGATTEPTATASSGTQETRATSTSRVNCN